MKAIPLNIKHQLSCLCAMIEDLIALSGMMRVSFGTTNIRCGKSSCWCADKHKNGHPNARIMWADETGAKTRSVRDEDIKSVTEAVVQYRKFKQIRRQLRIEEKKLDMLLDNFERETTAKNRSKLGYS